jgi:hypothetical protein
MAHEKLCEDRAGTLLVAIGRRYSITANDRVINGMANGMWIEVIDVHLCNEHRPLEWNPDEAAHVVSAHDVLAIQCHLHFPGPWQTNPIAEGIPVGQVLLRPSEVSAFFHFPRIAANPKF